MCKPKWGPMTCDITTYRIAELAKKNTIYWWTWNIKELTIIWITIQRNSVFGRRRNIYLGTTFPGGDAKASNYLHVTFRDAPTIENWSLTPKIQSRADSYESGDMLLCKFCLNNADWKGIDICKDHLWYKALLHTITKGKTNINGTKKGEGGFQ